MRRLVLTLLLFCFTLTAQTFDFTQFDAIFLDMKRVLNADFTVVVTHHGRRVFSKNYGAQPDTVMPIASASKWYSGALLMTLVQEGKVSLDDPVTRFLPEYRGAWSNVTIRHLFAHTSGLSDEDSTCVFNPFTTLQSCVSDIAGRTVFNTPGTVFNYANTSMHTGGGVIENVSGKGFVDLWRERIATPLEMRDSANWLTSNRNPIVAGGTASTANDYLNFLEMMLHGGTYKSQRILQPWLVDEMLRDQTTGARIANTPLGGFDSVLPGISQTRYGFGNWVFRAVNGDAVVTSSPGLFGFTPWLDQERNLTAVVAVNFQSGNQFRDVSPYVLRARAVLEQIIPPSSLRRGAVANAASYQTGFLAPGQMVTLFTAGFGPAALTFGTASNGQLQTRVANRQVLFDGVPAPILYVARDAVTVMVPFEVAGKLLTSAVLDREGTQSAAVILPVVDAAPGIFTTNSQGTGQAAAVNQNGSVNSASNPVARGSSLSLYAAGGGLTSPASLTGRLQSGALQRLTQPVSVRIGGQPAEVTFAGNAPGFVEGTLQINVTVPANAPTGSAVPVELTIGAVRARQSVSVAVN